MSRGLIQLRWKRIRISSRKAGNQEPSQERMTTEEETVKRGQKERQGQESIGVGEVRVKLGKPVKTVEHRDRKSVLSTEPGN